jgi:hypothetical protein
MARTLIDLAEVLETKAKELDKNVSDIAVRVALTIIYELAYRTPVDTSQAISNWQVTLGAPASNTILPHYPGKFGSTYSASAAETVSIARLVLKTKKPGQAIFISNNLPYIKKLNDGSSTQAPAGFIERAILLGRKQLSNAKV